MDKLELAACLAEYLQIQSRYRADAEPAVVFPWSGETSEMLAAILKGGNHLIREDGESAEAFMARAETTSER